MESLRRFEKSPFKTPQRAWFFELLLELEGKKGSEEIVKIFQNFGGNDKSGQTKKGNSFEVLTDLRNLFIGQFGAKKISERWFTRDPLNRTDLLVPSEVRDILDLGEGDNKGHDIVYKVIDLEKSAVEYVLSQAKNTSKRKIGRGILESTTSHLNKLLLSPEKPLGENPHYQISTLAEEIDEGIDIFPGSVSIIGPVKNNYTSFIEKHFGGDGNKLISALIEYAVSGVVPVIKERQKDKKLWHNQVGGVYHTKRCHELGSRASTNSFSTGTGKSNTQAALCFTLCSDALKIIETENFTTFTRVPNITLANQMAGDFLETSDEFVLSELGVEDSFDVQRLFVIHSGNNYTGLDECYLNDPRIVFIHTKEDLYNAMIWAKETKQWGLTHFIITNQSFAFSALKNYRGNKKTSKPSESYFQWASRKFERETGKKFIIDHRTNDESHHLTGIIRAENEQGEVLAKSWAEDLYRHSYLQGLDEIPYFVKTDSFWTASLIEVKELADLTKKIQAKIEKFGLIVIGSNTELIFGKINEYTLLDGQRDGVLSPVEIIVSFVLDSPEEDPEIYETIFDRDKVRIKDPNGSYNLISDPSTLVGEKLVDDAISIISKTQPRYKGIFKCNNEEKCKKIEELYKAKIPKMCKTLNIKEEEFFVGYVHSNLNKRENDSRIERFRKSKSGIIIQVNMLSEGFCEKTCNHTHPWDRIESSVTIQQFLFGRGIRKDPSNPNKTHYITLPIPCTNNLETGAVTPLLKEWISLLEGVMRIGWNPSNFVDKITISIEASEKSGENEIIIQNSGTKIRIPNIWKEWTSRERGKFYKSLGLFAIQMREEVCSTFEYPYEIQKSTAQNNPRIKGSDSWTRSFDDESLGCKDWYKYSRRPHQSFPDRFEGWEEFSGKSYLEEVKNEAKKDFLRISKEEHDKGFCYYEAIQSFCNHVGKYGMWGDFFKIGKFNPMSKELIVWKGEKISQMGIQDFCSNLISNQKNLLKKEIL